MTFPDSLDFLYLYNNDFILDLSSTFDFNNINTLSLTNISGITGDFSNMIIDNVTNLDLNYNSFNIDLGNLKINWGSISRLNVYGVTSNVSDLTPWFPSGVTSNCYIVYLYNSTCTGDITNWNINTTYLNLQNTNLTGDITNWDLLPLSCDIENTYISGNLSNLDFTSKPTTYFYARDSYMSGDLSGVTLPFNFTAWQISNCTGATNIDSFFNYLWINRKNWTQNFYIYVQNLGDYPSGTYQLGDLGTYGGHEWDLTETEINFLVSGDDYTGTGSNTPWTTLEKYYYHLNAKINSGSTTKKYKINSITYI